ncbi:extracellular solute-binding protein [Paenibacillus sp. HB172176]|uniref:extracellular solute-binding protein n=1 Tax=Paenibacillus sp. HB172176 TaxID=2493690 RepID=UPI00143C62ED|nr:extracellular solute-binding protein [Paenibacillus sp. HB172176]
MKRRNWISAVLVLMLAMAVMAAGCSNGNDSNTNSGGKNGNATGATSNASGGKQEEKPTLKLLRVYMAVDYNTYPVNTFLEEKTDYKLQNDMLPQEKPSDKLNLIMASGSDYDLVDAQNKQDFFNLAQNGALTDLTPLIDEYGPNIKEAISQESLDGASLDGKIYGIPTLNVSYVRSGLLIRTDWLEKVGKKMPTTLDEFVDVLKAFKDQDPGGNGKNNIALTMDSTGLLDNVMGAFGIYGHWNDMGDSVLSIANHPQLKAYATFMRKLYDEGLLDNEFATNKSATSAEKFTSGRAGVILAGWSSIPGFDEALKKNAPNATYEFIPPMQGPDGQSGLTKIGGFNKITFIPKSSKHAEDAIKLVNAMLEKDTFKELFIGEEGVTYKVEDGNYMPIAPAFFDERGNANSFVIGMDEANFVTYWQARLQKSKPMFDNYLIINNIPEEQIHQDPLSFSPYLPQYSNDSANLASAVTENLIKMIVDGVTDDAIADLQKAWKAAGGEAVSKEINDWFSSKS